MKKNYTKQDVKVANPEFLEFLEREFNETAANATVEEKAEFALGSIEKAIETFENNKKKK